MDEKTLLKIGLIITIVGITILYFISGKIDIEEKTISKITAENIGEDVKIKGTVSRVTDLDAVMIIDISQPNYMTAVLFKDGEINIKKGDYVEITGEIDEYEGEYEIIGNKVKVISE